MGKEHDYYNQVKKFSYNLDLFSLSRIVYLIITDKKKDNFSFSP